MFSAEFLASQQGVHSQNAQFSLRLDPWTCSDAKSSSLTIAWFFTLWGPAVFLLKEKITGFILDQENQLWLSGRSSAHPKSPSSTRSFTEKFRKTEKEIPGRRLAELKGKPEANQNKPNKTILNQATNQINSTKPLFGMLQRFAQSPNRLLLEVLASP